MSLEGYKAIVLTADATVGGNAIQKYAGTAMPYPLIKNLPVLNHDGMVPFYMNHLGRHEPERRRKS